MLRESISPLGFRRRYLVRDQLTALDVPTLIAWGEKVTSFYPPSLGREIATAMAEGEFVLFSDAGHMPWIDQPDCRCRHLGRMALRPSVGDLCGDTVH